MFFKKYHTLKIRHKKFTTLKENYVFTSNEIKNLIKVLEILYHDGKWNIEIKLDIKDKRLSKNNLIEIYKTNPDSDFKKEIPDYLMEKEEIYNFLIEKGKI